MKNLITLIAMGFLFQLNQAYAEKINVDNPSKDFYRNIMADDVSFYNLCPENAACFTDGTNIEFIFNIDCHKKLVLFNYKTINTDQGTVVVVNAVKYEKKYDRPVLNCSAIKSIRKNVTLINIYDNIKIIYQGFSNKENKTNDQESFTSLDPRITLMPPVEM